MRLQVKTAVTLVVLAIVLGTRPTLAQPCRGDGGGLDADRRWFIVNGAALTTRVDPDLLAAIAQVESDNCATAVSPAGAAGLMQLVPATADRMGVADRFDPAQSALGAARLLAELQGATGVRSGLLPLADVLAAYNAGEGAVRRYGGVPPYSETQHYVRSVLTHYLLESGGAVFEPQAATPGAKAVEADDAALRELARIRAERGPARRMTPSATR